MKATRIKPALKYQLISGLKALGVLFAVLVAIIVAIQVLLVSAGPEGRVSFNGLGLSGVIMFFVLGLVTVRENLKLFLQNGCGRPTLYVVDVLGSLLLALLMALGSELLIVLLNSEQISLAEIFFSTGAAVSRPLGQSLLLRFCGLLLAWRSGMFVSLVYYRLNRLGQTVVSVAAVAVFFVGLPMAASRSLLPGVAWGRLFQWAIASPYNLMLAGLGLALLFSLGGWLLLRRAPVRE